MSAFPCYRCQFMTPIKARVCNPAKCEELSTYLMNQLETAACVKLETMKCPRCGSKQTCKCGFDRTKHQLYRCNKCRKRFRPGYSFKKKHPRTVIQYAKRLARQDNPAFSTRDISRQIKLEFQINVSNVTVAAWLRED